MKLSRRHFIKASAVTGGAMLVGLVPAKPVTSAMRQAEAGIRGEDPGQWMPSTCQGCTTWCPIEIFVQDGRAVKVRGNQLSRANSGFVCPRGHMIIQQIYDPDRIKTPMKRTNPVKGRGVDPGWIPISWDEATDVIADQIMELRKNNETHKYLLMRGRYSDHNAILYDGFTKVIGSPNNISHSAICAEVEKFGRYYTQGYWGYGDYDLENMKYLIVWACDPVSSNRQVPNTANKLAGVLERGTVVTIDPRLSNMASKGHEWLPIKPQTDTALAVAMAHVILTSGLWYREFVGDFKDGRNLFIAGRTVAEDAFAEKLTYGLVKWWNIELKDRTPQWAEQITGIDADAIVRVATGFAQAAPNCAVWFGPNMQPRGSYAVLAMHALNGLTGSIDNEGGYLTPQGAPSSSYPDFSQFQDDQARAGVGNKKIDQRGTLTFPALNQRSGGGVVTNNTANAILAEDPYDIKVAIGYYNNFNFSGTDTGRWDRAMAKVPFFAHIVTMASEMSQFADILLPAAIHHSEQWAIVRSASNLHGHISLQQPLIKPLFDVKAAETEVVWMIAEKLKERGFANPLNWLKMFKDPETGTEPGNAAEFGLYATKIRSQKAWDPIENADYEGDRVNGWDEFVEKGIVNSPKYRPRRLWTSGFPTETGKFEFYSETLKKVLIDHAEKHEVSVDQVMEATQYDARGEMAFVPHYETIRRHGDRKGYPFDLVDMKSRFNREARSANLSWYYTFKKCDPGDVVGEDVIQINPGDAKALGVTDGDLVKVSTVIGNLQVRARLWEGVQPGTVAKTYGQGHWAYGRIAAENYKDFNPRGANFNEIMPDDYDRLTGSTARNGGFTGVKIEKV